MTKFSQDDANVSRVKPDEILPILPPMQQPITEPDWRKVPQPKPFVVRPPKDAPNVALVLLDQVCYSDPCTFGDPIRFPTLDLTIWFERRKIQQCSSIKGIPRREN
ncbi:MAG: hypothetical protein WBF33_13285 [Candidatus Nitrosopolaris sp.]